jgi:hypothetical protein
MSAIGSRKAFTISLMLFAGECGFYSIWPLWRAFFPLEIDIKEGWNAYHADAAIGKDALYPPADSFIANNYPPLSYYLVGILSYVFGDAITIGRILSIVSTLAIAAIIGLCIRQFKGSRFAALFGSIWFLGTMVRYADWYVGMNDPHIVALALMCVALLLFIRRDAKRCVEPIILITVIAGFFKNSLLATPATILLLLARYHRGQALRAALFGICAAIIGIFLCTFFYGIDFIDQVFFYPREISLERALSSLDRLGGLAPALIVWAFWAVHDRRSEAARFTMVFVGAGLASYMLQRSGEMTDINAQFELIAALGIGIGVALERVLVVPFALRFDTNSIRAAIVGVLGLVLVAAPGLEPYLLAVSADYRAQFFGNTNIMKSEVNRVAAIPGKVACIIPTVCRAAGKAFVYDDTAVGQKIKTGRLTENELQAQFRAQGIRWGGEDVRASLEPLRRQLFYGRHVLRDP